MIPAWFADILPASLEAIGNWASHGLELANLFRTFKAPFDFINAFFRAKTGITRKQAGEFYRLGKYFANQGRYLEQLPPDVPIDPRLARNIPLDLNNFNPAKPYRYQVNANVFLPQMGDYKQYNVWVHSRFPLTPEGAIAQGLLEIADRVAKYKVTMDPDNPDPEQVTGIHIGEFHHFVLER